MKSTRPFSSLKQLRSDVQQDDTTEKNKQFEEGPKASLGYGGKFGVQTDRMDKVRIWTLDKFCALCLHLAARLTLGEWILFHEEVMSEA